MDLIEQKIIETIDANREVLIDFARDIALHAESGFFETRTAQRVNEMLQKCGLETRTGLVRTGIKAILKGGKPGPRAAIIGELDGICCPSHPQAVAGTGMTHACGHNAQLAAMLGAAIALSVPEVARELCGSIAFFAVPAEEYVPAETRQALLESDGIEFDGGKPELVRRGEFDDIDLSMTTHIHTDCEQQFRLGSMPCTGNIAKTVIFHGRAAHAGAAPHKGVNAVNAAVLALSAIGLIRETFRDEDSVRIHTNILEGGTVLNVVPDRAVVEIMLRGSSLEAIADAGAKVNRACTHAALALGATAEISTLQGFMPLRYAAACPALLNAAKTLDGYTSTCVRPDQRTASGTDVGDLSQLMPIVNFTFGGAVGELHGADFRVTDEDTAYVAPAKMCALAAYHLLKDNAALAQDMIQNYKPSFTKEEYIKTVRGE